MPATNQQFSGDALRRLRTEAGLSVTQLAAAAGVGYWALESWERGDNAPRIVSFFGLVEALGCDATDLITENDPAGRPGHSTTASGRTHGSA